MPAVGTKRNGNAPATRRFRNYCYPRARFCPPLVSHVARTGRGVPREYLAARFIRARNAAGALKASSTVSVKWAGRVLQLGLGESSHSQFRRLTMRLSDAGLRQRPTKLIYPDHRPSPWLTEVVPRDRSNRLLDDATTGRVFGDDRQNHRTHLCNE